LRLRGILPRLNTGQVMDAAGVRHPNMNAATAIDITADDFALFGLPQRFDQERHAIDARWRELQSQVHPDRFAAADAAAQRRAMQQSVRVNEAHRRLRDPLRRAAYLCELRGAPIEAENNTAMPRDFLMHQMQWREALDEAASAADIDALERDVASLRDRLFAQVSSSLDAPEGRAAEAAQAVRALMFVERFRDDLEARRDAIADA
jgi:molecular chaperone HscB